MSTDALSLSALRLPALALAGAAAGVMNAVAGGGSFVTFPALVLAGLPPVLANASSTVALFPGGVTSAWALRRDLGRVGRARFASLVGVSAAGGLAGALLLLTTPARVFDAVLPWLMLLATASYAAGPQLRRLAGLAEARAGVVLATQFVVAVYAGYFGGAAGILMMAAWALLTTTRLSVLNPARSVCVNAANATAVLCFVAGGRVAWDATVAMMVGAVAGGYLGARVARAVRPRSLRVATIALSVVVTVATFLR